MHYPQVKGAEFTLAELFEHTPDLVCVAGNNGYFLKVNAAVIEKLGYTEEELMSRPIDTFIHQQDKEFTARERGDLLAGKVLLNLQNRYVSKTGEIIWLEWTSRYFPEAEIVFAIAKDVTKKKLAEEEVKEKYARYKSMAKHFKSKIESERKFIADELHEELAQLISVLKMDLDWISTNEQAISEKGNEKLAHALALSDLLMDAIRRISFSISPKMLEDLGLNATLEWHCKEFSILNGIPCRFETDYDEQLLNKDVQLDFFRICQEALTNIMFHARASEVVVGIHGKKDKIILSVSDNGIGFHLPKKKKSPGITKMRQLARLMNGKLKVRTEPGKGTTISVLIPQ